MPILPPVSPSDFRDEMSAIAQKVENIPEPGAGAPGHDLVIVVKSLMRGMLMQARAFAAVIEAGLAWPAGSNLRCMLDVHIDLRVLLSSEHGERLARQVVLDAMRDMAEEYPEGAQLILEAFEALRRQDPAAAAEFERALKDNRGHWSGKSRRKLIAIVDDEPSELQRQYKGGSWSTHMVIEPVLDYSWLADGGRAREQGRSKPDFTHVNCRAGARLLQDTWHRVAEYFRVPAYTLRLLVNPGEAMIFPSGL
jgi:hypothetical protein